jgi:hypothetical protein
MLCPECNHDNPPGYSYCGLCGQPPAMPAVPLAATTAAVRTWPAPPAPAPPAPAPPLPPAQRPWVSEEMPGLAPSSDGHQLAGSARSAITRYLCAAVSMDPVLERRVIDDILEEENRAIVTTPGADLVTITKYALSAHRRRLVRDGVLLADLAALIVDVYFLRSALLFLLLLIVGWAAVFAERYASQYGSVVRGLRAASFDPDRVRTPPRSSYDYRQLQRIAAASTTGNVTLYRDFPPFVGYGGVQTSWSFAIDVTRPRRNGVPTTFAVREVYDHVKAGLLRLDLPGVEITDRLFVNGRDIDGDRRFLPGPGKAPVTSVRPELVQELMATPEERARPYLAVSMTGWQGDLVVTTFIRFLLSRSDLFVESAHTVVPPLRHAFRAIDERDPAPTVREFFALVTGSALGTVPRLFGSVAGIWHELASESRRERKRRRTEEAGDYGPRFSLREAAADTRWHRYFQKFDDARHVKVVEQRIFRSLTEFLEAHDIDTSALVSRTETVINNGVMVSDKATFNAAQVAAGAGAHATGLFSRVRAQEGAPGSAEGRS